MEPPAALGRERALWGFYARQSLSAVVLYSLARKLNLCDG